MKCGKRIFAINQQMINAVKGRKSRIVELKIIIFLTHVVQFLEGIAHNTGGKLDFVQCFACNLMFWLIVQFVSIGLLVNQLNFI